jgi:hypothetical protein
LFFVLFLPSAQSGLAVGTEQLFSSSFDYLEGGASMALNPASSSDAHLQICLLLCLVPSETVDWSVIVSFAF